MEPIYGQTWQQVVANQGPIAPEQAIAQILKVCQVLDYLHQQSPPILHLALSPDTLIRRPHSATSDLGVLGLVPGRREEMVRRFIPAAYAAPEQQQGQASPAADLYALGLTLVYLVTGQPPRSFYAQREQGFRFYPEYIPGLPADLITILRKLTNPQPDERFATAQELADVLQQLGPVKV
jgi:serine/threonine-protein kinase